MANTDTLKLRASNRRAGRKKGGTAAILILLTVIGLFMALPIYLTVVMSVKPVEELFVFPPKLYAVRPTLDNFRDMFRVLHQNRVPFSRYIFNSLFVTVAVTVLQCVGYKEVHVADGFGSESARLFFRFFSLYSAGRMHEVVEHLQVSCIEVLQHDIANRVFGDLVF